MNSEDKQRVIGKVVAINSDRFTIELLGGIDNFNINGFDDIHYFAQLNSYVVLPYQNHYIIAEVSGVREKDINAPFNNPKEQFLSKIQSGKFIEVIPFGTLKSIERQKDKFTFDFGVSVYPALYTDVLYIKDSELDAIFNVDDQEETICTVPTEHKDGCNCKTIRYKTLSIGKSSIFPDYDIKIDIDKFFGNHSAILGNTGSGKSCTISAILQGIFKLNSFSATGATFILFDINGEYLQSFEKINETNTDLDLTYFKVNKTEKDQEIALNFNLPHWFLNFDEWTLLLQATEKTQQPVLRLALNIASLLESEQENAIEIKNHIVAKCCECILTSSESPVAAGHRIQSLLTKYAEGSLSKTLLQDNRFNVKFGNFDNKDDRDSFLTSLTKAYIENFEIPFLERQKFDLKNLYEYLDIAILYEESFGNKQIRDYCSSLLTRAKSISERKDLLFLSNGEEENIIDYKKNILGLSQPEGTNKTHKKSQLIIFDLHSIEDEVIEIITCVLSRILFETAKEIDPRNTFPINLVLEEAHRYISNDPQRSFLKANRIFELVAKEGRKFGMLLLISSQRPSELSKTVLSQCSNFIVHRIQNPEDLFHIKQITPHISETILKRLPSIPTQHALIFGHAVNLPTTFKVNNADPTPKSDSNRISLNWFKPKNHIATEIK